MAAEKRDSIAASAIHGSAPTTVPVHSISGSWKARPKT